MARLTRSEALALVRDRLSRLYPIERELASQKPDPYSGTYDVATSQRVTHSFGRWYEGTYAALENAGLTREAQRLHHATKTSTHTLEEAVSDARATLDTFIEQITTDPHALGLKPDPPPRPPEPADQPLARVAWPWIPTAALAGFAAGLFGRGLVIAGAAWIASRFKAAQLELQRWLTWMVDALTPGPAVPVPAWTGTAATLLVCALLAVTVALLVELLAVDLERGGTAALWRSPRPRARFVAAVGLSALLAALAR